MRVIMSESGSSSGSSAIEEEKKKLALLRLRAVSRKYRWQPVNKAAAHTAKVLKKLLKL